MMVKIVSDISCDIDRKDSVVCDTSCGHKEHTVLSGGKRLSDVICGDEEHTVLEYNVCGDVRNSRVSSDDVSGNVRKHRNLSDTHSCGDARTHRVVSDNSSFGERTGPHTGMAMECTTAKRAATLVLALFLCLQAPSGVTSTNQTALMSHLFDNYENNVRPICGTDVPITVKVGLAVRQIIELDEPKQILYLNAWVRLQWTDCQLTWTASAYNNIDHLIVPYKKVWTPDITLYDNSQGAMPGMEDYRVAVYTDGTAYYNFPTVISVLCKIDVTYFPFDTQKCSLQFGSWAYHGLELNLTNRDAAGDISAFVTNSEFDITSMPLERHEVIYSCCVEPYPDVTFYVYIKRKPMFYVLNLMLPCIIITSIAALGFLLPPEAGEKTSLGITVLLALAVFLLVVSETLPPTSETFPHIGIYFAMAMLLVALSTVLSVVVLNIHHKEHRALPRWMKIVFLKYGARWTWFSDDTTASNNTEEINMRPRTVQVHNSEFHHHNGFSGKHDNMNAQGRNGSISRALENTDMRRPSRWIESGASVSPFTIVEPQNDKLDKLDFSRSDTNGVSRPASTLVGGGGGGKAGGPAGVGIGGGGESPAPGVDSSGQLGGLVHLLSEQLRLLQRAEDRQEDQEKVDAQRNDWRIVAIVMDRLFLALFLLITFITSMAILVPLAQQG